MLRFVSNNPRFKYIYKPRLNFLRNIVLIIVVFFAYYMFFAVGIYTFIHEVLGHLYLGGHYIYIYSNFSLVYKVNYQIDQFENFNDFFKFFSLYDNPPKNSMGWADPKVFSINKTTVGLLLGDTDWIYLSGSLALLYINMMLLSVNQNILIWFLIMITHIIASVYPLSIINVNPEELKKMKNNGHDFANIKNAELIAYLYFFSLPLYSICVYLSVKSMKILTKGEILYYYWTDYNLIEDSLGDNFSESEFGDLNREIYEEIPFSIKQEIWISYYQIKNPRMYWIYQNLRSFILVLLCMIPYIYAIELNNDLYGIVLCLKIYISVFLGTEFLYYCFYCYVIDSVADIGMITIVNIMSIDFKNIFSFFGSFYIFSFFMIYYMQKFYHAVKLYYFKKIRYENSVRTL